MKQSQPSSAHPGVATLRKTRRQPRRDPVHEAANSCHGSDVGAPRAAEDPGDGYHAKPRGPGERLRILVLEERQDSLYAASRLLKSSGYTTSTTFEEGHAVASILAAEDSHFLLLTVHATTRPLSVPRLIERLRQLHYNQPITCCVRGKVSPATRAAYKALSVDRVLALPVTAQSNALNALAWITGQVALGEGGLTILEV